MTAPNVYPHGCGGNWEECPDCVHGWRCSKCKLHDNENDPIHHECKHDYKGVGVEL